ANGNFTYRKQGLSITVNGGISYNRVKGEGNSIRNNYYTDSTNFFHTRNNYLNKIWRPNFRFTLDYDINKSEALSFVLQYNQNHYDNSSTTEYRNINRFGNTYKLSDRTVLNNGETYSPNI